MSEDEKKPLQAFDDDAAFLNHIISLELPEELVEVPEWGVSVLCKPLDAATQLSVQMKAYDQETKRSDYSKVLYDLLVAGCYNPTTGKRIFTESKRAAIMKHGTAVQRLASVVLRLSSMIAGGDIKKN